METYQRVVLVDLANIDKNNSAIQQNINAFIHYLEKIIEQRQTTDKMELIPFHSM